ncbi:MAG: metal ABC transporter substrate-binding protein [Actinomycetaceae bacterium]|nr:metal ABC transporter substrate-binding protein [Actinomycetaceae bacterium]
MERKKTYRRTLVLAIIAVLGVSLSGGCSTTEHSDGGATRPIVAVTDRKPVVLTTFTVIADMAEVIGGDDIEVASITRPGAEIHDYQPTQEDIKKAQKADLVLRNGMGLERWFDKFIHRAQAPSVVLSEGIDPINIAAGDYQGKPNPHAWMSTDNALVYVENIAKAFGQLLPKHKDDFESRAADYKDNLKAIGDTMKKELSQIPKEQRALVTCEGAFSYLARDMDLEEKYLWPVNAENALTPQSRAGVEQYIREHKVPAVFCESTVEDKMKPVVENTDTIYGGTLYVDSLSQADGPVPTYEKLLEYDATIITQALTGKKKN